MTWDRFNADPNVRQAFLDHLNDGHTPPVETGGEACCLEGERILRGELSHNHPVGLTAGRACPACLSTRPTADTTGETQQPIRLEAPRIVYLLRCELDTPQGFHHQTLGLFSSLDAAKANLPATYSNRIISSWGSPPPWKPNHPVISAYCVTEIDGVLGEWYVEQWPVH